MSSNVPISNSSLSSGLEKIQSVDSGRIMKTEGEKTSTDDKLASIQTTKELKQAELHGESITISDEQIIKAIEGANKALQGKETSVEFKIHEKTKQIMIKVQDKETGRIIREIPPEKILDMVAKMSGLLMDERR